MKKYFTVFIIALFAFSGLHAQPNPNRKDLIDAFADYPKSVHKEFIAKVFDCDENKKLHAFTLLLTPSGRIQFGSNPPTVGRKAIELMLISFNKQFKHLSQHIQHVYFDSKDEIVYTADATYSFENGEKTIPIPYAVHLKFSGGLVYDYVIYIDLAPFYKIAQTST